MLLTIHNHALLRGMVAGAVAFGLSACSRSDRTQVARDTTQTGMAVTPADTHATAAPRPVDTAAASARDTGAAARQTAIPNQTTTPSPTTKPTRPTAAPEMARAATDTSMERQGDTVAVGDSARAGKPEERLEPSEAAKQDSSETLGRMTTDSSEMAAADTGTARVTTDTSTAGYEPMARDTSTVLAQADTSVQAKADTTAQAEADTTAIRVQVDTTAEAPTEVAVESRPDTVTVVGDSSSVDKPGPRAKADTVSIRADSLAKYHEADRIRPPEDSTEVLGNADQAAAAAAGVPSTGNIVTGADAVALMSREGQPCRVESSSDVQWDLAASPTTLNPCGTGTMTLPKVQTGREE